MCHGSHNKAMKYDKKQRAAWQCLSGRDAWRVALGFKYKLFGSFVFLVQENQGSVS